MFHNWLTNIYDLIDEDRFPEITDENQAAFVQEVKRRVTCSARTIDDDYQLDDLDDDIPTDESLNCGDADSATLTSGIVSITTSISDELETAKSILGLPNVFVEDIMVRTIPHSISSILHL